MKIKNAKVDWMLKWGNSPYLKIWIDEVPELKYQIFDNYCYWAENEGFVNFGFYNFEKDENQRGYGGREWKIPLVDGSEVWVRGPGSGRSGVANKYAPIDSTEMSYVESEKEWNRGFTFTGAAITVELAEEILEKFIPESILIKDSEFYEVKAEPSYTIVLRNGKFKPNKQLDPKLAEFLKERNKYE